MISFIIFFFFAAIAVIFAAMVVLHRNPVVGALSLVASFFALAVMYVLLEAPFLAALQVIVYAGAIMVLFLFVIMLLNLGRAGPTDLKGPLGLGVGVLLAGLLLVQLLVLRQAGPAGGPARTTAEQGMIPTVARPLFTTYLVPFEITSLLLLAAIVGAVVLAKRKL